ncbi:MAG: DUF2339 domain-containing protein [Neisseriaceae bacterium]|nr:DUF2339 domain-containing protein [Neisseriaceae bacterium]
MFERDELDEIKAQMKLLKHELHALRSRLSVLEQQNVRLFEENRSLSQLAHFRQPENSQSIDISNISQTQQNTENNTTQNETVFRQPENAQSIDIQTQNNIEKTEIHQPVDISAVQTQMKQADKETVSNETPFRQPEQNITSTQNINIEKTQENQQSNAFRQPKQTTNAQNDNAFRQPEYAARQMPFENNIQKNQYNRKTPDESNAFIDWLTGGNVLLKTGVLVLFLGLAFLLRYVGGAMPLPLRYLAVFAAGVAAAVGGEYLQAKRREYGLILQGFGFGVMYLTALAAVKLHNILPNNIALILMVISVALMSWRAVVKDAKILAQVAVLGGLFAPVLVSDGTGSHISLFAYLAVLNTGVAAIAWFKAWRSLNLIGAIGTFWIALLWSNEYQPHLFASCEVFLIYHWLLYTLVACFFAHRTLFDTPLSGELCEIPNNASLERIWQTIAAYGSHIKILDSTLLFGTALSTFGLQYAMVKHWDNAAAYSALLWAAVYGGLAFYYRSQSKDFAVIKQAFAVLCGLFVTLAVPLALEQQWTATAWALEAALVYVFGLTQKQPHIRLGALGVFALAALKQFQSLSVNPDGIPTILQGSIIGAVIVVLSGAAMYFMWDKQHRDNSAEWEKNTLSAIAVLTLMNTLTLPLLTLPAQHCVPVLSAMAVAFAALQWKKPQIVFGVFSLISILLSISCVTKNPDAHIIITLSAIAWLATAYLLHHAVWRRQAYANADTLIDGNTTIGIIELGLGLVFAIRHLAGALLDQTAITDTNAWGVSILLIWFVLWLFATQQKWLIGIFTSILLALANAFFVWTFAISAWKHDQTQMWGGLILLCGTILAVVELFRLPEKQKANGLNVLAHAGITLSYIFVWTVFLYSAHKHFNGVRPLETLIVPLSAWLFFTHKSEYLKEYKELYQNKISMILATYSILWLIIANFARPVASSYIPLLNTIEIGSIAVLWQLWQWHGKVLADNQEDEVTRYIFATIALSGLFVLSCAVMRCWHYYNGIAWNAQALLASFGVQATLSIIWAIAAIVIMVWANRKQRRTLWIVGASLMGVVVCKLFLVELGNSGGIERIISFIAVGLLLLFVGWFAPVPPKGDE